MKQERRGSWYLLTGIVLGAAVGLIYSWVISPVKYVDAPPYALRADYKDEYRALVAAAYLYSYDLVRAEVRLAQLNDQNIEQSVTMQAQRALAEGHPEAEIQALSQLAAALGQGVTPAVSTLSPVEEPASMPITNKETPTALFSEASASPEVNILNSPAPEDTQPVINPSSTYGPMPISTITPTLEVPFVLQETRLVCNNDQSDPLIQVEILDAAGQPIPSIELVVTWEGGEDHFFTGLKPELSLGYADFRMIPDTVYSIHLTNGGQAVNDLTAAECVSQDNSRYWGSWYLIFRQP